MAKSNRISMYSSFWHNIAIMFLLGISLAVPPLAKADVVTDYSKIYYYPQVVYPNAAFAQVNAMSYPNQIFATETYIYVLSATKITVWKNTKTGPKLAGVELTGVASGGGFKFSSVQGMAKHPTENKFVVVDQGIKEQRLMVYSFEETSSTVTFTYLGQYGDGAYDSASRRLVYPYGVTFGADGKIHVLNTKDPNKPNATYRNSIVVFSGSYSSLSVDSVLRLYDVEVPENIYSFPLSGTGLAIDETDQATKHYFIASAENDNVFEITNNGDFVRVFGVTPDGSAKHLNRPFNVAVWNPGIKDLTVLFVTDQKNNRVVAYIAKSDGTLKSVPESGFLTSFGGMGNLPGQMKSTFGIFLEPVDDTNVIIYITEYGSGRIQKFNFNILAIDNDADGVPEIEEFEKEPPPPPDPPDPPDPPEPPELDVMITDITKEHLAFKIPAEAVKYSPIVRVTKSLRTNPIDCKSWVEIPSSYLLSSSTSFSVTDKLYGGAVPVKVDYTTHAGEVEIFVDLMHMFANEWRYYFRIKINTEN